MPAEHLDLEGCMRSFVHGVSPAWVLDPDAAEIVWANAPALVLWRAESLDELRARDLRSMPESIRVRTKQMTERVRAGEVIREEWVFYPKGQPTPVTLDVRGVVADDARVLLLCQSLPAPELTPELRRALVINRHVATISALIGADGQLRWQNVAAEECFIGTRSWFEWLATPAEGHELVAAALAGERVQRRFEVVSAGSQRWHFVDAHMLHDPVSGDDVVLVEHTDETARIEAEQRAGVLGETLALVEAHRLQILALSAPILDVGHRTLAVPIIGQLGAEHSEALMTKLLDAVGQHRARRVILDVTGVVEIDARSANRLRALVGALRLLGASATITGVRPELALALIESGVALDEFDTRRSLAEALLDR